MNVELLNDNNIDVAVDLFIDTFTKEPWCDVYESRNQVVEYFNRLRFNNYFIGYVLKDYDEIIGLSLGYQTANITGMDYFIDQFCIKDNLQGQGIGKNFIRYIEKDLYERNVDSIILTTRKGFVAETFYIKNGFSIINNGILLFKDIKNERN